MSGAIIALLVTALLLGTVLFSGFKSTTVYEGCVSILYRNGQFERELPPGRHHWFDPFNRTVSRSIATSPWTMPTYELSLLTKDQFSFRMSVVPVIRITGLREYADANQIMSDKTAWPGNLLFSQGLPQLHAGLAAEFLTLAATKTLDEFLADPTAGIEAIKQSVSETMAGAALEKLLLTAITMPPEVRKMFTEVERAKREGLAALERARAETAALRALANAARSLDSNPNLVQLRILQAMESSKGAKTFVLGSDGLSDLGRGKREA